MFAHAVLQALAQDAQHLGGAGDVAAAALQCLQKQLPLVAVHQFLQRAAGEVGRLRGGRLGRGEVVCGQVTGQMLRLQGGGVGDILGVVDDMEQFPHIARPVVGPQQVVDTGVHRR